MFFFYFIIAWADGSLGLHSKYLSIITNMQKLQNKGIAIEAM